MADSNHAEKVTISSWAVKCEQSFVAVFMQPEANLVHNCKGFTAPLIMVRM